MLNVIRDCCIELLSDDDFWIAAAMTGCSFETAGSADFCRVVSSYNNFGLPPQLCSRLLKGVNGNLAALVEDRYPHLLPFTPNLGWKDIRPDLHFGRVDSTDEVIAEIKAVFDLTTRGFYSGKDHSVADDLKKLRKIRADGFKGHLFQVVFFTQLPFFERPGGTWMSSGNRSKAWKDFRVNSGIEAQYRYLRRFIVETPAWPADAPHVHTLVEFGAEMLTCMTRRYTENYKPDDRDWNFVAQRDLADAAAGFAIWEY